MFSIYVFGSGCIRDMLRVCWPGYEVVGIIERAGPLLTAKSTCLY